VSFQACAASKDGKGATEMIPSGKLVDGVRVVEVTANDYKFIPDVIVVNEGERVRLDITAVDKEHGISIPAFNVDKVLPKGKTESVTFDADKVGKNGFRCSVFCGIGHAAMKGELVVLARKPA